MTDAAGLHRIYRWLWRSEPESIWEIGSRDGLDALALAAEFECARVLCFEPNPDTWGLVVANVARYPRIEPRQCALTDRDGEVTFFKIDPARTVTTWPDGNPGASSLFKASGSYPIESYAQTPVQVVGYRADTVIRAGARLPDLIWMDVQGAELLVLKGFGARLREVKLIQTELSLEPIYEGQPLAPDVVSFLRSAGFKWHSVPHPGAWQFDAVFVRPGRLSPSVEVRDWLLRRSLGTRARPGIERPVPSLRRVAAPAVRRIVASALERSESRLVATGAEVVRGAAIAARPGRPLSPRARRLFEMSQRSDPLRSATPPPRIDALVPCAEKDLPTLPLVIASIHSASVNPVDRVVVVVRRDLLQRARAAMDAECDLVAEEDLLDEATRNLVDSIVPADRRGWVVQQLAKFEVVASSPREGVLVVDADTVMLRPRTWLTDSRQLLVPVHEFHSPYEQHFQRFFGRTERAATVSWVAHHQLMRPPTVRAMFGLAKNERSRRLGEWVAAADFSQPSALSEYHTYGRWLETRAPDGYALGRWGNKAVPRTSVEDLGALPVAGASDGVRRLRREFPTSVSISMHAYL